MWIDKKRFMAMEANINRLVHVQQQQHKQIEDLCVLLNGLPEEILIKSSIPHTSASGNEAQNTKKLRK
jgi:hypothetical protein